MTTVLLFCAVELFYDRVSSPYLADDDPSAILIDAEILRTDAEHERILGAGGGGGGGGGGIRTLTIVPPLTEVPVAAQVAAVKVVTRASSSHPDWPHGDDVKCIRPSGCPFHPPELHDTPLVGYHHASPQWIYRRDRAVVVAKALRSPAPCDSARFGIWDTEPRLKGLASLGAEVAHAAATPPPPGGEPPVNKETRWRHNVIMGWPRGPWTPPACSDPRFPCVYIVTPNPTAAEPGGGGEAPLEVRRVLRVLFSVYGIHWVVAAAHPTAISRVMARAATVRGATMLPWGDDEAGSNVWHVLLHVVYPGWMIARSLPGTRGFTDGAFCANGTFARPPPGEPPRGGGRVPVEGEVVGCPGTLTIAIPWWRDPSQRPPWPGGGGDGTTRQWIETVPAAFATVVDASAAAAGDGAPIHFEFVALGVWRFHTTQVIPGMSHAHEASQYLVPLSSHVLAYFGFPPRRPRGSSPSVLVLQRTPPPGGVRSRLLVYNESAVAAAFAGRGWRYLGQVVVGKMSALNQLRAWATATVSVSPHGAQAVSYLFSPRGGMWLEVSIGGAARCYLRYHSLVHGRGYAEFAVPASRTLPPGERASEVSAAVLHIPTDVLVGRVTALADLVAEPGDAGDALRERCAVTEALMCYNG